MIAPATSTTQNFTKKIKKNLTLLELVFQRAGAINPPPSVIGLILTYQGVERLSCKKTRLTLFRVKLVFEYEIEIS